MYYVFFALEYNKVNFFPPKSAFENRYANTVSHKKKLQNHHFILEGLCFKEIYTVCGF